MSKILKTNGCNELVELDTSWFPWRYQVNRWTDGASYGKPGQRITCGMANFETLEAAQRLFGKGIDL